MAPSHKPEPAPVVQLEIEPEWLDWPPTDDEQMLAFMARLKGDDNASNQ